MWHKMCGSVRKKETGEVGMSKSKFLFLSLLSVLLLPCPAWAWSGKVVGVANDNSITVLRDEKQVKILLYGIDCPEDGQAFGKEARQFISDMVVGKIVEVHRMGSDRYRQPSALVAADKMLLNEELVKAGLAWVYVYYCSEPICESWKNFQLRAKMDRRGLWADPDPIAPWDFRIKKGK
jgi:endonuclease YncB( thermonuclease family)